MSLRWLFSDPIETFSAALAGACFVALTQLVTREALTPTLQVSVALFSVAIPFLVMFAVIPVPKGPTLRSKDLLDKLTELLFIGSSVAGLLGIACLFWFVQPLFGCAFAVSSIGVLSFLAFRSRRLKTLENVNGNSGAKSAPKKFGKKLYVSQNRQVCLNFKFGWSELTT